MSMAAKGIQWDGHSKRVGPAVKPDLEGPRLARGKGMALSLRHGYASRGRTYAVAEVDRSGKVIIKQNAMEIGEGCHTVVARVASQTLGIPESQIQVTQPDTALNPYFVGIGAQLTTVAMGNAVLEACQDLKREVVDVMAKATGGIPEEWRWEGDRLWRGEQDYTLGEVIGSVGGDVKVMGKGSFSAPWDDTPQGSIIPHWSVSVGAAEVEVDRETGEVRLLQYVNVGDVGKAINPASVQSQLDGGAIMGLGHTFFEALEYGEGKMLNGDPMQYRLPLLADLPENFTSYFTSYWVENGDGPGPFGSKGTAQVTIVVIAPAVANAIFDAIGIRIHEPPITPEKVLRALGKL